MYGAWRRLKSCACAWLSLQMGCGVVGLGGGKSSVKLTLHMSLPQQQKWYVPFWICGGRLVTTQRSSRQPWWSPRWVQQPDKRGVTEEDGGQRGEKYLCYMSTSNLIDFCSSPHAYSFHGIVYGPLGWRIEGLVRHEWAHLTPSQTTMAQTTRRCTQKST